MQDPSRNGLHMKSTFPRTQGILGVPAFELVATEAVLPKHSFHWWQAQWNDR